MNDCKDYVAKCVVCNRAKPDRRGSAPVNPLPVPTYPWEVVGVEFVDYVTNLPKSGKNKYTAVMIVVCHLTKMKKQCVREANILSWDTTDKIHLDIMLKCTLNERMREFDGP